MRVHGSHAVLLVLLAGVGVAQAAPPASAPHVDPNAPCYRWPAVDYDGDGVFDRIDYCNDTPRGCTVDAFGCTSDGDGDGVCSGLDRCPGTAPGEDVDARGCSERQRGVRATPPPVEPPREIEKPAPRPRMSESERRLVEGGSIRLENLYFETNSAELLPESEASLREAGDALEKYPDLQIEVEGHSDTRGPSRHNLQLSQARAEAVRRWLLDHHRLRPDRITARGYGEQRPETKERNAEELLRNRRVVLRVRNPEALPRGVKVERRD